MDIIWLLKGKFVKFPRTIFEFYQLDINHFTKFDI